MKVKYTKIFNRKNKLRKDGTALIQIRAYLNGENKYFSTKIYVTPRQWDVKNKQVIKHSSQRELNNQIRLQIQEMEVFELKTSGRQNGKFHLPQLENYQVISAFKSFTDFFEKELYNENVKESTRQTYITTLSKFKSFKKVIFFQDLNYNLIRNFDLFLQKSVKGTNTRAKYHKIVKKFINLSIKLDLLDINSNPYKRFEVKREQTTRTFLVERELAKIEALEISEFEISLQNIKDLFLFSCYTGLRYSDVSRVAKCHIITTDKGYQLDMISQKTSKRILLPLYNLFPVKGKLSKPEQLIKKYLLKHKEEAFDNHAFYDDMAFFRELTEQHVNRELKNIGTLAGIEKSLTTHVGRHTFGTSLATKVKLPVLQKMMQHSKLKETMIYVHLSNEMIENALENVKW